MGIYYIKYWYRGFGTKEKRMFITTNKRNFVTTVKDIKDSDNKTLISKHKLLRSNHMDMKI